MPRFPYGAVYFRKSNPPSADWKNDYERARDDGHNAFRHWFLWSAIEVAPGTFDWDDYDRQLDLAAECGIKTIIAEMITAAPEWAFRTLAHCRYLRADGTRVSSAMGGSSGTGGFPGLCLDNEPVRAAAERFLVELVNRYQGHPGLGGYDVWNECGYQEQPCYCPATVDRFRAWLRQKYGGLPALAREWRRHSLATWDDVAPPRVLGPYLDSLDWLAFRQDAAYEHLAWRARIIREHDPDHLLTAHGVAASLHSAASRGTDDWRAAAHVDVYGLTWGSSRHGDEPWKQLHAMDLVRAASRGKPFWHAEAYAGPLWMQPQVLGRPRDDGRIATPEDIRYWNLVSFCGGATGVFYLRWRPLLEGPLFGAFGPYAMDGSRTDRSEMVSALARWVTDPGRANLWRSGPIVGDIGIVYVPESQLFNYVQQGSTENYSRAMQGAYQAFFDNNIQADFVHIDDIADRRLLYLPYPVMLTRETAQKLIRWVEQGGMLISEGCPAYFGDRGRVGTSQPNYGLDALFGASEHSVEFVPDLLEDLELEVDGQRIHGAIFTQAYAVTSGTPVGRYDDGRVAAVDADFGSGRTRLVGTFPSVGYHRHHDPGTRRFFASLLGWAHQPQHVTRSNPDLIARIHSGPGGRHLWVLNPSRVRQQTTVTLSAGEDPISQVGRIWGDHDVSLIDSRSLAVTVDPRDGVVLDIP